MCSRWPMSVAPARRRAGGHASRCTGSSLIEAPIVQDTYAAGLAAARAVCYYLLHRGGTRRIDRAPPPATRGRRRPCPRGPTSDAPPPASRRLPPVETHADARRRPSRRARSSPSAGRTPRGPRASRASWCSCAPAGLLAQHVPRRRPLAARRLLRRPARPRRRRRAHLVASRGSRIDYRPQVARVFGSVAVGTCARRVPGTSACCRPRRCSSCSGSSFFAMSDDRRDGLRRARRSRRAATRSSPSSSPGTSCPTTGSCPRSRIDAGGRASPPCCVVPARDGARRLAGARHAARHARRARPRDRRDARDAHARGAARGGQPRSRLPHAHGRGPGRAVHGAHGGPLRHPPPARARRDGRGLRRDRHRQRRGRRHQAAPVEHARRRAARRRASSARARPRRSSRGRTWCTIYEVGTIGANGAPYIAMELLRGHDLAWHLRQRGAAAARRGGGAGRAGGAARSRPRARPGIVHRDLKPQNLFLAQQNAAAPTWKILDFGVSRLAGTTGTLTMDQIVGTPGYMSPEQAAGGREVDAPQRRVLVRRRRLPRAHRAAAVLGARHAADALPGRLPQPDAARRQLVAGAARGRRHRARHRDGEGPRGALRDGARDGGRPALGGAKATLDPSHRVHAQTLLAALPWGSCCDESDSQIELLSAG